MSMILLCDCGSTRFLNQGATISPGFMQRRERCEECGRTQFIVGAAGGAVRLNLLPDVEVPKHAIDWLNDVMLPTWRAASRKADGRKTVAWKVFLSGMLSAGEVPTDYPATSSFYNLPTEVQNKIRAWEETYRDDQPPVYPPRVPRGLDAYYMVPGGWDRIDYEVSAGVEPLRDPILVDNEDFFEKVWPALEVAIERPLPPRREAKNEYGGIEPWYAFDLGGATITVGWRKRVVEVRALAPFAIPVGELQALAACDEVTFDAHQGRVLVHAWTHEKLVEYLVLLCRAILLVPQVPDFGDEDVRNPGLHGGE